MKLGPVDYTSSVAPTDYRCTTCHRHGCKLWRQYQTFANHIRLLCCDCAAHEEKETSFQRVADTIGEDGCWNHDSCGRTDSIGFCVPAVPTPEGDTYWGYTSVPPDGVTWWRRLPTRVPVPIL